MQANQLKFTQVSDLLLMYQDSSTALDAQSNHYETFSKGYCIRVELT